MLIVVWTFRLAEGVTEEEFLVENERMQTEFLYHQPGFVRRTTARGPGGDWLVLAFWSSKREAESAGKAAQGTDITNALSATLDRSTLQVKRFETLD